MTVVILKRVSINGIRFLDAIERMIDYPRLMLTDRRRHFTYKFTVYVCCCGLTNQREIAAANTSYSCV